MAQTEANLPEPNIDEYLARIGVQRREPSPEYLNELIFAHQCAIPFENVDVFCERLPLNLTIEGLFDKIVRNNRGGYCYELNGLFSWLLRQLGFQARGCLARIVPAPGVVISLSHRVNLVTLEGKGYLCDVGMGGPAPSCAMEVKQGASVTLPGTGEWYGLTKEPDGWWTLWRDAHGTERECLRFTTLIIPDMDFEVLSFYLSMNEKARFRNCIEADIRTAHGHKALSNFTLSITDHGEKTVTEIAPDDLATTLREHFLIDIPFPIPVERLASAGRA